MTHPALALLAAFAVAATLVLVLWPEWGILWRALRLLRASERVLVEDALKHLFDCEYRNRPCTLESLSGALSVPGHRAASLLARLETRELVSSLEGSFRLTPAGRRYALRVVRIHRLWERYLSERTGLEPSAWHHQAEQREHLTSPEEADALSARLGHPRWDPHGDPIPTASGEIAPPRGRPLTDLEVGRTAEIAHVEDEPPAIYAQLVAEGLHPGLKLQVLESSPQRIRFEIDAEEHVLAPVLAANLSVVPLPDEEEIEGPFESLSGLEPGESGRVVAISPRLRGPDRRRMLDLGLVPGTLVSAELRSPGGDPTAYRIRGAVIALRNDQAEHIRIERVA